MLPFLAKIWFKSQYASDGQVGMPPTGMSREDFSIRQIGTSDDGSTKIDNEEARYVAMETPLDFLPMGHPKQLFQQRRITNAHTRS